MKLYRKSPSSGDSRIYVDSTGEMVVPKSFTPVEIVAFVEEVLPEDDFDYFVETPFTNETKYFVFVSDWARQNFGRKFKHKTDVLEAVTCPHCLEALNQGDRVVRLQYSQQT